MSQIIEVKVPDIGDFSDVPVIDLFVKVGDSIKVDDAIATLESDKATMDVPSTVEGTVKEVLIQLGSGSHRDLVRLVDEIVPEGELRAGAIALARRIVAENRPLKKVRDLNDKMAAARGDTALFADFRKANARKFRGFLAPEYNIRCIEAAVNLPFDEGLKRERELFMELMQGTQSAAQRYVFFAERQVWKIPGWRRRRSVNCSSTSATTTRRRTGGWERGWRTS